MTLQFQKATRKNAKLRLSLVGPAGSGKTFSALRIASALGERLAIIDTERGSASKYAGSPNPDGGTFEFDAVTLESFDPRTYVEAIHAAESAGYGVVVIDSLSHAWSGKDGALEQVDRIAKRNGGNGNSFTAWREVTPVHNALFEAILGSTAHIIATMRAKTEYVLEDGPKGKKVPRKVGMGAVQRDGSEYEFDISGDLDLDNTLSISKSRCTAIHGKSFSKPGREFGRILKEWLSIGSTADSSWSREKIMALAKERGFDPATLRAAIAHARLNGVNVPRNGDEATPEQLTVLGDLLETKMLDPKKLYLGANGKGESHEGVDPDRRVVVAGRD